MPCGRCGKIIKKTVMVYDKINSHVGLFLCRKVTFFNGIEDGKSARSHTSAK